PPPEAGRERAGPPAGLRIAAVPVDAPEEAVRDRVRDLVLEAVSGQGRVVHLDVQLDLALETELLEKGVHRRCVIVVLMLRRLVRLGLDEERAAKADLVL